MSNIPSYSGTSSEGGGNSPASLKDKAGALAQGLKDQATEAAEHIKGQAGELADSAKGLASDAGEKLRDSLQEQKAAGADYVSGIASAVRRAAGEFDRELPQAAQYIRSAAQQIDGVSNALRQRDFNELIGGAQDFARRQPTAFLGATVLAGFAIVRFLKSSASTSSGEHGKSDGSTQQSMQRTPSESQRYPSYAPVQGMQHGPSSASSPSVGTQGNLGRGA